MKTKVTHIVIIPGGNFQKVSSSTRGTKICLSAPRLPKVLLEKSTSIQETKQKIFLFACYAYALDQLKKLPNVASAAITSLRPVPTKMGFSFEAEAKLKLQDGTRVQWWIQEGEQNSRRPPQLFFVTHENNHPLPNVALAEIRISQIKKTGKTLQKEISRHQKARERHLPAFRSTLQKVKRCLELSKTPYQTFESELHTHPDSKDHRSEIRITLNTGQTLLIATSGKTKRTWHNVKIPQILSIRKGKLHVPSQPQQNRAFQKALHQATKEREALKGLTTALDKAGITFQNPEHHIILLGKKP